MISERVITKDAFWKEILEKNFFFYKWNFRKEQHCPTRTCSRSINGIEKLFIEGSERIDESDACQ